MRAIIHREMQVAARRKATYFFRAIAAGIALALAAVFFFFIQEEFNTDGKTLFWMLAISACFFSVREGFHRAAISLSEERANGTLGLLFLTTLKGRDVVLGKFASVSLQAFQMAAVAVPLLALTLLVGGVSIAEIARATLCLFNLTFFLIAVSLFISSITASDTSAVALSLFTIIAICLFGALFMGMQTVRELWFLNPMFPWFRVNDVSYNFGASFFWTSLFGSHALGWAVLFLSGYFLQRTWPKPEVFPKLAILWTRRRRETEAPAPRLDKSHKPEKIRRSTRILGNLAPLEWLLIRNIYPRAPLYFTLFCNGISFVLFHMFHDEEGPIFICVVTLILLAFSLTAHSSLTVARARKSGILELVAVAPLSHFEFTDTQIHGLRRAFLLPILINVGWLLLFVDWRDLPQTVRNGRWENFTPLLYLVSYLLMAWCAAHMGIWTALKEKSPARAFLRTAFLAVAFPLILTTFFNVISSVVPPILNCFYWLILGNVARQSTRTEFRELLLDRPRPLSPLEIRTA